MNASRRALIWAAGTALAAPGIAMSQTVDRYPDMNVQVLDPSFNRYRILLASVERGNLKISTMRADDKPISERRSLNKRGDTPCLSNSTSVKGEARATSAVNARMAPLPG